ncbi:MAG: class I SAM-dependent methyltransferase [Clostridium sp.]
MKGVLDFYNDTAHIWSDNWYENNSLTPYLRDFFKYLPNNPRILDLCCGAGYESMRMASLGGNVVGLDFSDTSIAIARERNPNIKFVVEDMLNDYSYLGKFNGCAVIAGLVHLTYDKLPIAFKQIHNVLLPNGILFIVVEDGNGKNTNSSYTNVNGNHYDREFYKHSLDSLIKSSNNMFHFVKEIKIETDDCWRYYIFKRENN